VVKLTPEDFREGARNKKIITVFMNREGLLVAGSNKGDVYMWQIDSNAIKKQ
jgi:hypothetical protein